MRLAQVDSGTGPVVVEVNGGSMWPLAYHADLTTLIRDGVDPRGLPRGGPFPWNPDLVAPVNPGKIIAIGLNYADHIRETGLAKPDRPLFFSIFPSCVIGPGAAIRFDPTLTERVDWEVELAVVVGKRMRRVSRENALDAVFGYTVANDVSARDLQQADGQWTRGKCLDTFCPLGPVVVTAADVADPGKLALSTRVNGETMQRSSTAEMIFGVDEILAYVSTYCTLEPGDVVLTGTPHGCGEYMTPKRSLHDGDVVEVEVEGIGVLRNPIRARPGAA
ncbi:MAG TPA: fumarylacetoacetate hydrolase family protein [Rugosimonospora sp.]|nr:fumarylacetoacetate hydrolase family protein [Rugosimonospora sp.]